MNNSAYPWAGLTCEGDATLVLDRSSVVRGFEEFYPGIYVPPFRTLVITGGGSLDASSNGHGAGIGGGLGVHCGNIGVTNGTVVATGGAGAAGIGGGRYGAWDAVNAKHGTYNVFLYAFGVTPYSPTFTLLDITFDEQGRAVVKTPPLKNNVGFTFTIEAWDNVDRTGNAASYPLHPSGETVIDETGRTRRFFRLSATER